MIGLQEQLEYFDKNFDRAYDAHLLDLNDSSYRRKVKREARRRLRDGFALYEDAMFRWPEATLRDAELQEDADAPNYRLARMFRGWK